VEYDRHVTGLFSRVTWLRLLQSQGFSVATREHVEPPASGDMYEVFVAVRPGM